MRKLKMLGKKAMAYALTACMVTGLFAGLGVTEKIQEVNAASTGFTQYDFLKVDGTYIKNNYGKGNNVYLRGTNIGNLFVQESWMSSTDAADQKTILEALTSRFGQDKALELLDYYESNYFTEADIDLCKNMGMSVIRVPFTYMNLYKKSGNNWVLRGDAFKRLDWIVQECSERGIYVILDLHGAFGSQNGQDHSGEVIDSAANVTFFSNETLMSQTLELWRVVAEHYKGNPAVAGYDTLNEPGEKAGSTGERHWNFYNRMYNTIRSVDPDHIVIMESCWGTSNLPNPSRYGWTNVVYEYHHYPWDYVADNDANYNGQVNAINNLVNSVNNANYGVPTFIGEFNCFDGDAKWQYVLDKMNKAGWHYTNWSFKSRGMGSWGIYHETGNEKVNPWSTSETDIRRIWGSGSVGTNVNDRGVTYNNMKPKMPGTVVFADKALTNDSYVSIKATINNKYVCADNYGESALVADRDSGGEWEQFRIVYNEDGTVSFQSRANNKYLCTVFDDTDTEHPIVARSNQISTWEKFYLEKQANGSYALRTFVDNYYVQADINDATAGKLHASATAVGDWEMFTFEAQNPAALPGVSEIQTQPPTTVENATEKEEVSVEIPTVSSTAKYGNNYKVVAYYPNWYGNYTSKVQWDKITHAYYAFGLPDGNGTGVMESLSGQSSNISAMINACNNNDVVPVLSVGGWSYSDGRMCDDVFALNTNTAAKCQSLAQSIVNQAKQYGFKGVDIDWEYPDSSTQAQYTTFMKNLRTLCDQNGMILTVAVAATSGAGFTSEVLNMLDFVNIMAYDGDSGSGHSPYSLATRSFTYWRDTMKVPANKLVIGVPFYERPNWASYADIVAKNSAYAYQDSAVINGTTVYYNGVTTMGQKATYAAQNAGGIMIWEISQDTTNASLSLLNAIYNATIPIVGQGSTIQATVTEIPGTIAVNSYGGKSSEITMTTENNVTYAGGLNNGSYLDYYIKVPQKGKYTITLNLAAGDAQWNADNVSVKLNDAEVANIPIVASSSWTTFVPHTAIINFAAKGTYKLSIVTNGGACNVTDFVITKNTEEITTQEPTTVAPETTTVAPETTTKEFVGEAPEEVFGVVAGGVADNVLNVVWGRNSAMEERGQLYNVYVDGVIKLGKVPCGSYDVQVAAGQHTVKVTSILGDNESIGVEMMVIVTGSSEIVTKPSVQISDKLEINGCQISTTVEGYRVIYSTGDLDIAEAGLVYGLAAHASKDELVVGSSNGTVYSYTATEAGKLEGSYSKLQNSKSYAMTMKFVKSAEFYNSEIIVRAYAKLKDGSCVYSDIKSYTVYKISDYLYQNELMNNMSGHDYLYNTILSIANPNYVEKEYKIDNILAKP